MKSSFKPLIPSEKAHYQYLASDKLKRTVRRSLSFRFVWPFDSRGFYCSSRRPPWKSPLRGLNFDYHPSELASSTTSLAQWPRQRLQRLVCPGSGHPAFALFDVPKDLAAVDGYHRLRRPWKIHKLQHPSLGLYSGRWRKILFSGVVHHFDGRWVAFFIYCLMILSRVSHYDGEFVPTLLRKICVRDAWRQ